MVPKAMRKKVLFLVLRLLDLTNPTDVAVATYMTKNLIRCVREQRRGVRARVPREMACRVCATCKSGN